jgi:hypothetical protein
MCRLVLPLLLFACNEQTLGVSNASPVVALTSHLPGDVVYDGVPFVVRAVGSDADSAPTELLATWSVAGSPESLCSGLPLADDGVTECTVQLWAESEPWRVQVEVRDEDGAVGTAAVDLEVVPQDEGADAPVVTLLSPQDGGTSHAGEAVIFEASVSDVQDEPSALSLSWTSDRDGEFSAQGADSSGKAQFVFSGLSPGPHVLTVRATDSDGHFTTDLGTWHVNGVPTAPVVSITPSDPSSSVDLQAVLDSPGADPEGLPVTHTWEWLRDGVLQPQTSSLVLGTDTTRGELWTVRVTPHDSEGGTGPYGEASVTIQNSGPQVLQALLSPDPAYTSDLLSVNVSTDDADGDALALTRSWEVNGLPSGTGAETLDGAVAFQRGDTVQVFVTAHDGTEASEPVGSNVVTIGNSAPTLPTVALAPSAPIEQQDDLYCTASGALDPDGDPVEYVFAWTVDGATYPEAGDQGPFGTTWPDDSAPAQDTTAGEEWTCEVVATDAQGLAGPPASASVLVEGEVFVPDYDGTFDIVPDISYSCAFNLVDIDVTQLTFSVSGATLSVSGGPRVMTGPLPTDENFTAQAVIAGGCTETYTVSGTFQDDSHFIGTFTVSFTGAQCGLTNCSNQAWPVDGYLQ